MRSAYTNATGAYDIGGLPAATYRLRFSPDSSAYAREFYNDKATLAAADDVVVGAGATVSGRNAQLANAGHITGTITGPGGTPREDVEVAAYQYDATDGWSPVRWAYTNAAGAYDLDGLAAGTYRFGFFDYGSPRLAQ